MEIHNFVELESLSIVSTNIPKNVRFQFFLGSNKLFDHTITADDYLTEVEPNTTILKVWCYNNNNLRCMLLTQEPLKLLFDIELEAPVSSLFITRYRCDSTSGCWIPTEIEELPFSPHMEFTLKNDTLQ